MRSTPTLTVYDKMDAQIEKWNALLHFGMMNMTFVVAFVPKILFSIYVYYAVGLNENDTLGLPLPMW